MLHVYIKRLYIFNLKKGKIINNNKDNDSYKSQIKKRFIIFNVQNYVLKITRK